MQNKLTAARNIRIDATTSKVWEVLIAPKYIRQWGSLPQDFEEYYLEEGRVIDWIGSSKQAVTVCDANSLLRLSLYVSKWELPPTSYDISYEYKLSQEGDATTNLSLEVGDFSQLPDGNDYYLSALEFCETALDKIKKLAENRIL